MLPEIVRNLATMLSDYCMRSATRNCVAELTDWFCFQVTATRAAKHCGVFFWWITRVIYADNFVLLRLVKFMTLRWVDHTARMDRQGKHKQF
jgi:hypothetical protein